MKDIRSLLNNYYFSRLEYQIRSKHDADYYSWLSPDEEPTKALIALETDILNCLKEELETTIKVIGSMRTERYKTLLSLRYIKNLGWSEIEKITGYSQKYLRGAMHRAALNEAINTQKEVSSS